MPTLAIPNMPEELMDIMESRAAANGRAVEDEALIWLQSARSGRALPCVQPIARKRTPGEAAKILAEVDRVRQSMPMIPKGESDLNRCDCEGRLRYRIFLMHAEGASVAAMEIREGGVLRWVKKAVLSGWIRIMDAEPSDPKPAASDIPAPARKMRGINADKPK